MPDKKLKDSETVKALECCCKNNNCEGCPLDYLTFSSQCASELAIKSLDLINRLQAQDKDLAETIHNLTIEKDTLFDKVEELKAEIERLKDNYKSIMQTIADVHTEAVKEFAERLKEKDELLEFVEHLNKYEHCKKCIHLASCDAWVRHSTRVYDDFAYSVEDCPYFKEMVGEDK